MYFDALVSIEVSCRIESDEVINSYFVNKCVKLIDILKKTSGDDDLDRNSPISNKIDVYRNNIHLARHVL